ncbi:MAG: STAS domain-containing protein [Geobacteraceae bacterium]|nr:STAS domain-containing protein [Geobacteraceae bacterium]
MVIYRAGAVVHLRGNLTHAGVTHNIINSLAASLPQIASGGEKKLRIDCKRIRNADSSGLQLLYVWMQCARFWGVEPQLVNLTNRLKLIIQRAWGGNSVCYR